MSNTSTSQALLSLLTAKVGNLAKDIRQELGDVVLNVERSQAKDLFQILRHDTQLGFDFFVSVTCVDWMDQRPERFELVYHLMSSSQHYRLRVKVSLPEEKPEIASMVDLWPGADYMERECWDMYGITFKGHPDLRRILMYDEFVGHPLRKDYPVQAKQPRIPLRAPEVTNTARDMQRPALVQIGRRSANVGESSSSR